jgi:hypothetical protein
MDEAARRTRPMAPESFRRMIELAGSASDSSVRAEAALTLKQYRRVLERIVADPATSPEDRLIIKTHLAGGP